MAMVREGPVAVLALDHPPGNRLTQSMLQDLFSLVNGLEKDADILVVVVTAKGGRAFCEGLDEVEWAAFSPKEAQSALQRGFEALWALEHLTKPTIAAIEGSCRGAGAELALACDLRFASDSAVFGFPQIDRAWMPSHGGIARLPRMIGRAKALELFLTGTDVAAREAATLRFVERVVPPGQALEVAKATAERLARKPRSAVHAVKRALTEAEEKPYRNRFLLESQYSVQLLWTDAYREAQEKLRRKEP
ncbi:MAG TPA: enoyl-CoA hydratase/isomerase family protein [Thermoplasmata archaeon]|nr:enoyl-CoA hydratase/isomerase family protein [Thermoplasmata archaeon]